MVGNHTIGFVTVYDGSIVSMDMSKIYDKIAIIVDTAVGSFHKVGDPSWVKDYYNVMVSRLGGIDQKLAKSITYIEFNPKTGDNNVDEYLNAKLSKDEICTFINYLQNSIGEERMNEILSMDEPKLHMELEKLNKLGF